MIANTFLEILVPLALIELPCLWINHSACTLSHHFLGIAEVVGAIWVHNLGLPCGRIEIELTLIPSARRVNVNSKSVFFIFLHFSNVLWAILILGFTDVACVSILKNTLEWEIISNIGELSLAVELFIFELALIYVLINHDKYSMWPLVINPGPFKLASIRPNHRAFPVSRVKFPISLEFGSLVCHYNIIELLNGHLAGAISFSVFKVANESIATFVLSWAIAIDAAIKIVAIHHLSWIFFSLKDRSLLILIVASHHLVVFKNAICVGGFAK